jgi:hypothetical protein
MAKRSHSFRSSPDLSDAMIREATQSGRTLHRVICAAIVLYLEASDEQREKAFRRALALEDLSCAK